MADPTEREIKIDFYVVGAGVHGEVTLFTELADVCIARGHVPLDALPIPHHEQIDQEGRWHVWVNASREPVTFRASDYPGAAGMDGEIQPFQAWVNWNGWLWGLLTPTGKHDEIMSGDVANPERFVTDCRSAADRARGEGL